MVVRDGARFLAGAIESVLDQTRPPDEILVVDGCSADETLAVAARYDVAVVQQPGTGIADARNFGITRTRGQLVAFLDNDDRWLPTKLERQLDALDQDSAAGFCVTMLDRAAADDGTPVHPVLAPQLELGPVRGLTPSALVVRRSALETIGLFDPEFGLGCDTEWFARASALQVPRVDIEDVLVEKLLHDRNASIDTAATRSALLRIIRLSVRRTQHVTH